MLVVRWSGGQVIASESKILERYFPLPKGTPRQNHLRFLGMSMRKIICELSMFRYSIAYPSI